jgi:hypothetical protein
MILTGADDTGGYTLGDPLLLTSLEDLDAAGITSDDNPFAYKEVKEFYDEAGKGASLYLMLVADTMSVAQMCDKTNSGGAIKLLNYAQGAICILGAMSDDVAYTAGGGTVTTTTAINGACITAATNLKAMAADYFAAQTPFRGLIGATSYSGVAASLPNLLQGSNNRVGFVLGDTVTGSGAALGLALGRLAKLPVQRKMSRVLDGPLANTSAFLGTSTVEDARGTLQTILDKGFISWFLYPRKTGYFYNGDATNSPESDDYHQIARGRVIDKLQKIAYDTYIQEVDNEVATIAGGLPDPAWAKWLEQQVVAQGKLLMVESGECEEVVCEVPLTQNIVSTNKVSMRIGCGPVGYATFIDIELGYKL